MILEDLDGLERTSAGGERILHHHHRGSGGKPSLDPVARAVGLGGLSDGKRVDGRLLDPASVSHGIGHRIGAHGESAHPFGQVGGFAQDPQGLEPHQVLPFGREERLPGINVVAGTGATGENEVPALEGARHEEVTEAVTVVHHEEISVWCRFVKPERGTLLRFLPELLPRILPRIPPEFLPRLLPGMLLLGILSACGDEPTVLPSPRFAQIGELRADVEVPLAGGDGRLEGTLVWQSDGRWVLVERMYYRDRLGEEVVRRSRRNPGELSGEYTALITQLNETPGLRLPGEVEQEGPVTCATNQARVTFAMVDAFRGEVARWTRCAIGNFFTVTPGSGGSDLGTPRVVTAVQLTRSFTIGDAERSVFEGSLPFSTVDRGADSPAREARSRAFLSSDGSPPPAWVDFWNRHAEAGVSSPTVDWNREMVLLATPGRRMEAGHAVGVRRILPVGVTTQVQAVESVPGDFCAPAALERYPYHLVIAPRGPAPVDFADLLPQRIPCGG